MTTPNRKLCVAPMMDWTDRHCRYFLRLISPDAFLFTEMVTPRAILFGDKEKLLGFSTEEHPIAVQLGGSDPSELAQAARICEDFGYDEINLNVGCPSDRVKSGMFGACMMAKPQLVGECIAAMAEAVDIPVTVKCRIGIDDQDSEEDFSRFIEQVAAAGCNVFYVHARKAWLKGLSPKQNRTVPPLDHDRVHRLKKSRPDLEIITNGGIDSVDGARQHLKKTDGIMLGRAAYHNPWILADLQQLCFPEKNIQQNREDVLKKMLPYARDYLLRQPLAQASKEIKNKKGDKHKHRLHSITQHIMGLYAGQSGARAFRRYLSEEATRPNAPVEVLERIYYDILARELPH